MLQTNEKFGITSIRQYLNTYSLRITALASDLRGVILTSSSSALQRNGITSLLVLSVRFRDRRAVSSAQFIRVECDRKTTMNCEQIRIRKKAIVACVALLSQNSSRRTEEKHEVSVRIYGAR
jgi:hypothetical protein